MSTDELVLADLRVSARSTELVRGVGLRVRTGQVVGIVGPSGSGKTLTARALLGMVDVVPGVTAGQLTVRVGTTTHRPLDPLPTTRRARDLAFRALRGDVLGYLPQDAPRTLDPARRVRDQLVAVAVRGGQPRAPAPWLERAGFAPDEVPTVLERFPHQLSGGMAQRVAIAQLLARGSRFLIADEPTTGLDAAVQRQLLDTLRRLADEGLGVLIVSHDLRWLGRIAEAVHVFHEGRSVETLTGAQLRAGTASTEVGRRLLAASARLRTAGFP